jgi:hypothetical protein
MKVSDILRMLSEDGRSRHEVAGGRIGFAVRVEEERDPESGAEQNSRCQNMQCFAREVRVHFRLESIAPNGQASGVPILGTDQTRVGL